MAKRSAGILPYRYVAGELEVLLVHPGGPYWAKKDIGAWSVAKGEYVEGEDPFDAALREFREETGHVPAGPFRPLHSLKQPSGKIVQVWAVEMDWDPSKLVSNPLTLEWPKGSGIFREFPEVDRAEWLSVAEAQRLILLGQRRFIEELRETVLT